MCVLQVGYRRDIVCMLKLVYSRETKVFAEWQNTEAAVGYRGETNVCPGGNIQGRIQCVC